MLGLLFFGLEEAGVFRVPVSGLRDCFTVPGGHTKHRAKYKLLQTPPSLPSPSPPLEKKGESLKVDRASTSARALHAFRAKNEAVAGWTEARARAEATERSAKGRVRKLEEEEARLRRELGTRVDTAKASKNLPERTWRWWRYIVFLLLWPFLFQGSVR